MSDTPKTPGARTLDSIQVEQLLGWLAAGYNYVMLKKLATDNNWGELLNPSLVSYYRSRYGLEVETLKNTRP